MTSSFRGGSSTKLSTSKLSTKLIQFFKEIAQNIAKFFSETHVR